MSVPGKGQVNAGQASRVRVAAATSACRIRLSRSWLDVRSGHQPSAELSGTDLGIYGIASFLWNRGIFDSLLTRRPLFNSIMINKRKWIIAIGLAALFLAVFIGLALWQTFEYHNQNRNIQDTASDQYASYTHAEQICGSLEIQSERLACLVERLEAHQQRQRANGNLYAQLDLATWTFSMLWVGIIGIIVSVLGIAVVIATLRETRRMTIETRKIGEEQARAYVSVRATNICLMFSDVGECWMVGLALDIENSGKTPAKEVHIRCSIHNTNSAITYEFTPIEQRETSRFLGALSAGQVLEKENVSPWPIGAETHDEIVKNCFKVKGLLAQAMHGNAVIVASGRIDYGDIFGASFFTEFQFIFNVGSIATGPDDLPNWIAPDYRASGAPTFQRIDSNERA